MARIQQLEAETERKEQLEVGVLTELPSHFKNPESLQNVIANAHDLFWGFLQHQRKLDLQRQQIAAIQQQQQQQQSARWSNQTG